MSRRQEEPKRECDCTKRSERVQPFEEAPFEEKPFDPYLSPDERLPSNEELAAQNKELRIALKETRDVMLQLEDELNRIAAAAKVYGRVVYAKNEVDPDAFQDKDPVVIRDKESPYYEKVGRISGKLNKEEGTVIVEIPDDEGSLVQDCFLVGLPEKGEAQVKLLGKNDGTFATVLVGDTPYEVGGVPGLELGPGDKVKVNLESKQIMDRSEVACAGVIAHVVNDLKCDGIEIEIDGARKVVHSGPKPEEDLKEGDRVLLDTSSQIVIRHLPRDKERQYNLTEKVDVTWEDIGGCEEAKTVMKEAIELPFEFPGIYKHYNKKPPKGILLCGPPGCGKTMVGKATTNSLADIFGAQAIDSGFIYVKGPEILNMYVGNSERNIREIFTQGREHFKRHNFPATIFIDEADAVLRKRGTSRSSDVDKTIVPMFLSEMDGLAENHSLVLLATNRPKVPRPDPKAAIEIFKIHLQGIPFKDMSHDEVADIATKDIFRESRKVFKIVDRSNPKADHFFTFADMITGSMIAGMVDQATSLAIRRDIDATRKSKAKKRKDVCTAVEAVDMKNSIEMIFQNHKSMLNADFDLEDYYETHELSAENCEIAKVKTVIKAAG
jgi:proteasome-associated ATPase